MSRNRPIYFNGKFYGGGLNGVHRVADRLIRECDARLADLPPPARPPAVLFAPAGSDWVPELKAIRVSPVRNAGQAWEQFVLPVRAADGVLVNLANLAPILHRRKLTMMHDVQFLFEDCGYPLRQRLGHRLLAPRIARSSTYVLTVSDYSRRMLQVFNVSPPERTRVVRNGADHILESGTDEGTLGRLGLERGSYVAMFSSPKAYKNNQIVFDAFADGALGPTRLVLVGPGREELEKAGLAPPEDAVFAGRIDDRGLKHLLAHAVALAFPSRTEGFGLPPLEAMLCRCPVVASPAGAIPESCGDAAVYAGVDDPAAWRRAIARLRDDPAFRARKIADGQEHAGVFTWANSGSRLFETIEEMARS